MSLIRKLAFAYFLMFMFVVALDFVPAFKDASGNLFSLFSLDLYDNSLHTFSGLWALIAGIISTRQSILYFKIFGVIYFLDGVMGTFLGNAFLDFGIFLYGTTDWSLLVKVLASLPHVIIGGIAAFIGFKISRKPWAIIE